MKGKKFYDNILVKVKTPIKLDKINMVFLVSTGRTGTKYFADFFNRNFEKVIAKHEPIEYNKQFNIDFFLGKTEIEVAKKTFLTMRRLILKEMNYFQKEIYIESDGNNRLAIPLIQSSFPNYKIVHIIRDPRTWIRSFASRKVIIDGRIRSKYNYDKYWPILPHEVNDVTFNKKWESMDIISKGAWSWKFNNNEILKNFEGDINCITFRFEDLFGSNNSQSFRNLISFVIGKQCENQGTNEYKFQKPQNISAEYLIPEFKDWLQSQKDDLYHIAGDLMKRFNYL